jgi:hypothetical protein
MLTTQQLQDIEQLQKECETHDHLQLKLNWEMLRKRETNQLDFFHPSHKRSNIHINFKGRLVSIYGIWNTVEIKATFKDVYIS